jgi:hemoglobin-like flavoprotein
MSPHLTIHYLNPSKSFLKLFFFINFPCISRASYSQDLNNEVTLNDVSRLFSHQIDQQEQLIFASQLCNSIFNMQERIDEKTNILYAVEQAISNELNHVLHQQHYDILPSTLSSNINENNSSISNDLITLKNSIYRSRELSRLQSKEMHDLDLSLREMEILLATKYDELKYLEYETSSNLMVTSRSVTPNYLTQQQQQNFRTNIDELQSTYDTLDMGPNTNVAFTSIKEVDEDSGINSLTSEDSNHHHSMSLPRQKLNTQNSQLETLV